MVSGTTILVLGILGAFVTVGGVSLVRPAITNLKSTKQSIQEKINSAKTETGEKKSG